VIDNCQTAECGWQNYPGMYGYSESVLFIYWTADGYSSTGCYDLTCSGFVHKSPSISLGQPFSSYSSSGGAQYEIELGYQLNDGGWWLNIGGTWVGYYPTSIYNGGPMTNGATLIEYGTEGVGSTIWPAEGSGNWSDAGFSYAAYQSNVFYYGTDQTPYWAGLVADEMSPSCYTISGPYSNATSGEWANYFYEGGPGGTTC